MARVQIPIMVIDPATGIAVNGATVLVKITSSGAAASLYAAATGGAALSNSVTTASDGTVTPARWVDRGQYDITISGTGISTYTFTWDAAAASDASVSGTWISAGSVDASKLGALAVTTAKIDDGAVTAEKLSIIPAAMITRTSNQSIPDATNTTVGLTVTNYDTGVAAGFTTMVDGVNSVYARRDGLYSVNAGIQWAVNGTGRRLLELMRVRSGTTVSLFSDHLFASAQSTQLFNQQITRTIDVLTGDQFYLRCYQSSTAALNLTGSSTSPATALTPFLALTFLGRLA